MQERVHEVLHAGVLARLEHLEDEQHNLTRSETGTLALLKNSIENASDKKFDKIEAKLNWIIGILFTAVFGILMAIFTSWLGGPRA